MAKQTFHNVWDALTDSPEESAAITLRSEIMSALRKTVNGWGVTQAKAAKRLGVTQPRLNDLLRGKIDKFSLESLLTLAARAELRVKIKVQAVA